MKHSDMTKNQAEGLWNLFEPFQGYGFNKAHAACYGRVAYQTAYMKANFPSEYMTAVLTAESGNVDEVAKIVIDCKRMRIDVLPPDVNESFGDFTVIKAPTTKENDKIRFGLYTIKNFGEEIANSIITERKKKGAFTTFSNFLERIHHQNLNKRSLEALIKAGAMDSLGERGQMLANVDEALAYAKENAKLRKDQDSLFVLLDDKDSIPDLTLKNAPPAQKEDKLSWEKEHLGLFISGHPLDKHKNRFSGKKTIKDIKERHQGAQAVLGGIISDVRFITTKRGERMAFVKLSDFNDSIEVVFFPSTFAGAKDYLSQDSCVAVSGRTSHRNDEVSIIADKIKPL